MAEKAKFLVYRNSGNGNIQYERYEVPVFKGMNVLDALFYIQDYCDSTLAFRYACRGAICGSCGLTIDKIPLLACRTQIATIKKTKKPINIPEFNFGTIPDWNKENEILIEPLPNMEVFKDLVVDMELFWNFYNEVEPYFVKKYNEVAPESKQSPQQMKIIEHLVYCIQCGLCWACPVSAKNPNYLGPAQLAKADRFINDSRITKDKQETIVSRILKEDAVPACEKLFVCNRVCPKGVMPGTAIKDIRDKWMNNE
jgi:succinate dehydrogenase / fumarate reductase iron-sulfur subunit